MYAMCADDWLQEKSQNSQNIHIKEIIFLYCAEGAHTTQIGMTLMRAPLYISALSIHV